MIAPPLSYLLAHLLRKIIVCESETTGLDKFEILWVTLQGIHLLCDYSQLLTRMPVLCNRPKAFSSCVFFGGVYKLFSDDVLTTPLLFVIFCHVTVGG